MGTLVSTRYVNGKPLVASRCSESFSSHYMSNEKYSDYLCLTGMEKCYLHVLFIVHLGTRKKGRAIKSLFLFQSTKISDPTSFETLKSCNTPFLLFSGAVG